MDLKEVRPRFLVQLLLNSTTE
eukprot:CCRYP_002562-RD/>CCRYP_002562-RD protein AED:0.46 eAED:0.46 QI:0/-1/0/1/-1/0/1/0/21